MKLLSEKILSVFLYNILLSRFNLFWQQKKSINPALSQGYRAFKTEHQTMTSPSFFLQQPSLLLGQALDRLVNVS